MAEERVTGKFGLPRCRPSQHTIPYVILSLTNPCNSLRGHAGDEVEDVKGVNMAIARRRSNSSSHAQSAKDFKTKFETIEPEPVFEESMAEPDEEGLRLEQQSTTSSDTSDNKSIEGDAKE
jgi:hypothetical protein